MSNEAKAPKSKDSTLKALLNNAPLGTVIFRTIGGWEIRTVFGYIGPNPQIDKLVREAQELFEVKVDAWETKKKR